jgi:hypothetical protein
MKMFLYDASKLMLRIVAVLLVMALVTDTDGKNGGMMTVVWESEVSTCYS